MARSSGIPEMIGGLALGFSQSKGQAQQRQMMEEYKKAQVDELKARQKFDQSRLEIEQRKADLFLPYMKQFMGGGGAALGMPGAAPPGVFIPQNLPIGPGTPGIPGAPSIPGVMGREMPPPGPPTESFEQTAAKTWANQNFAGLVKMAPEGQKSTRYNNPYNVEYRPWQNQYGATMGSDQRFGQYPNPVAGVAAATDLIQQYAKQGKTLAQAIETFAPTSENPNTPQRIVETARALNVSPDTPLANVPLGPFMTTHVKYESPTQVNPAIFADAYNKPIGQTIGTNPVLAAAQQQQPQRGGLGPAQNQFPTPQPMQTPTPMPERQITQKDVLAAGWKWLTGSDLKDEKYDYRMTPSKDVMVLKDGNAIKMIPTGPDIAMTVLANGDIAFYDRKSQSITKVIGTPPEMTATTGTDPATGRPYAGWRAKPKYPSQGGGLPSSPQGMFTQPGQPGEGIPSGVEGGMFTGPGTKEKLPTIPEAINQKIATEYDPMINTLGGLKNYALQNKDVFGLWNQMKFGAAENKYLREGMSIAGMKVTPELIDFYKTLSRIQNLEVHAFGGSNLTVQELRRALTQLPMANNADDFKVAVDSVVRAYDAYKKSIYDFYSKTEDQRTRESLTTPSAPPNLPMNTGPATPGALGAPPSGGIPQGAKPTGRTSGGKPVYQLPDGKLWVP